MYFGDILRGAALRILCLGFLATSLPALAQEGLIEEVVVVGSRIKKPDFAYSNPILSVDAAAIQQSGTTNLVDYLKTMPALTGSLDSNDAAGSNAFIGGAGLSLLNLRNLGVDRTLVLVDGRRHVAGLPGSAAVDIDTIPIDLIERVEVLTGGASAIYGADGVSGVVNFVMKDNFEGVVFRARGGQSDESDRDSGLFSLTAGQNFAQDRGNVTLALEYSKEDRLKASERDFAGGGKRQLFMNNPFGDTPTRVPLGDVRFFDSSPAGAFDVDADFNAFTGTPDFDGDDTPWDSGTIPYIPPFYQQGGDGSPVDSFIGDLLPEEERMTANLLFDYEFSEGLSFFGELKYSKTTAFTESQPTFDYFLALEPDYAYMPPDIQAAYQLAVDEGTYDPFGYGEFGISGPLVSRDNFDLGVRGEDMDRETLRSVMGLKGDFGEGYHYEVSYVYGQTKVDNRSVNNRLNDRFAAALDAVVDPDTGQVVCRSSLDPAAEPINLSWQEWGFDYEPLPGTWAGSFTPGPNSGCVPVSIAGNGSVSPEAAAWIMANTKDQVEINQHVVQAFVSGDSAALFSLPAGPVGFAVGAEYRKEESKSDPAPEDRAGLTFGNILEPVKGDFDVTEAFVEVDVPLLADRPGAELLSLDGAARFSDYSTIGNATTWKLGLVWQPLQDLTFRGTVAEATRAPNIGELFDPGGQTFQFISDPCDVDNLGIGTTYRAANCAQLLTGLGVDPDGYLDPNAFSIPGTLKGNENLSEEVVETTTIGVIIRPRFIENLTISVDWYDIELKDAINTALPQESADLCVDLPTLDNNYCGQATREQGTGAIVDFVQQPLNVASFTTRGYDFTVNYMIDPSDWGANGDWGLFNFNLVGNKLDELKFVNLPGAVPDSDLKEEDAPEWQWNFDLTWHRGPLLLNYGINYFSETLRYSNQTLENDPTYVDPQYREIDEKLVQNVYAAYDVTDKFSLSGGVNNLTDEKPDIGKTFYPVSAVGRYYFVGLEFSL